MGRDHIACVGIDADGCLFVRPVSSVFPHIYRAAADVRWDEALGILVTNAPREMSYLNWFRQILKAVNDEYGTRLILTDGTEWHGILDDLRFEILADRQWREANLGRVSTPRM